MKTALAWYETTQRKWNKAIYTYLYFYSLLLISGLHLLKEKYFMDSNIIFSFYRSHSNSHFSVVMASLMLKISKLKMWIEGNVQTFGLQWLEIKMNLKNYFLFTAWKINFQILFYYFLLGLPQVVLHWWKILLYFRLIL